MIASIIISSPAMAAGGWTNNEVPIKIEIVRDDGFMIFGAFGNPGSNPCSRSDTIWVPREHPQYAELLSTALAAFAGQFKLQAYVHNCVDIGWHAGEYNTIAPNGALYISR